MTNIEKSTISLSKAAAVGLVVVGFVAQYFTTQNAVREGFNDFRRETDLKINNLENKDRMIESSINRVDDRVDKLEYSITTYIGKAIMPDRPKLEERQRR
jgi:vacuolar-type H+-ATPase subunit D/Vma8